MSQYPTASTIAEVLKRERRGVTWAKQSIELVHQNLMAAARDIEDTPENAEVRRAIYRAIERIRQARGAMTAAHDATTQAMLTAFDNEPVYLHNQRLKDRYSNGGNNGAAMVNVARRERDRREADYSDWERRRRERERQEFLASRKRED